ncbi:MAG TPA: carboxypeptidase regulatory-like domain-containing protein, partial [Anaerolineae bacterium]|nr:carboxypeptidase regulatory-like domain-containing protein [Anaerolineae bacterium]
DIGRQCQPATEGWLAGTVSDAVSGLPIAGAAVQAAKPPALYLATSGADGSYQVYVVSGTYTVTASAFAYQPITLTDVTVVKNLTTTQNIALQPAPAHVVSGTVTDATAGWPLYAQISLAGGQTRVWTNPATGYYSATIPENVVVDYTVLAWSPGYGIITGTIGPLTSDRTQNFTLNADLLSCSAPGYQRIGLSESFDSVSAPGLPVGWATTVVTSSSTLANWLSATATVHPSGVAPHSPPNLVYLNSYSAGSGGANRLYRTTGLNMTTAPTTTLSFWMYHETGYTTNADRVQVQVSIDGGTTWMNVGAPVNRYDGSTGWKQHSIDLSAYATQTDLRLGLLGISAFGNDVHLDDLTFGSGQCVQLTGGLVVGNVYALSDHTPLLGATVQGISGTAVTTATIDPVVPDSFYLLFAPSGTQTFTATKLNYGTVISTVNVIPASAVRADFYLPSPYGVTLAPTSAAQSGLAGSAVTYASVLTNTGNSTDSFTVTISAGTLFTNSVVPLTVSNLAAGATTPVTATVLIPANVISGTQEAATVTATSQGDPSQQATSTLTTTAQTNLARGVGLTPISAAKSSLAGNAVTYALVLTNTGNSTDSFTVTISTGTLFTNSVVPLTINNLAAGATAPVTATVLIPANIISGTQESALVTVTSQGDPGQHATSTLTTTAQTNLVWGVGLAPISVAQSGFAGSAVTYALTITNTGNATDSFTVTISAGTLFTNSVLPTSLSNLAAGATAPMTATVLIPSDVISGTQEAATVTVTSQGDPNQHATSTLTTTALASIKVYLPLIRRD